MAAARRATMARHGTGTIARVASPCGRPDRDGTVTNVLRPTSEPATCPVDVDPVRRCRAAGRCRWPTSRVPLRCLPCVGRHRAPSPVAVPESHGWPTRITSCTWRLRSPRRRRSTIPIRSCGTGRGSHGGRSPWPTACHLDECVRLTAFGDGGIPRHPVRPLGLAVTSNSTSSCGSRTRPVNSPAPTRLDTSHDPAAPARRRTARPAVEREPLAIASCGNAALAAATLAATVGWPIDVYVPTWMDPAFGDRWARSGRRIHSASAATTTPPVTRRCSGSAKPSLLGAIPFSVQGPENALCPETNDDHGGSPGLRECGLCNTVDKLSRCAALAAAESQD